MPPEREGPRVNEQITSDEIRLIDDNGENIGVLTRADALARAEDAGLDLVEVAPDGRPPVCKLLDYGKFKYQAQKRANEARKKQKIIEIKEIKMRPNIDQHDYDVKMRAILGRILISLISMIFCFLRASLARFCAWYLNLP